MKRFQLMQKINPEGRLSPVSNTAQAKRLLTGLLGLYAAVQAALPHFKRAGWKARIIVVSPPIYSRFFRGKTAYAMGASCCRSASFWPSLLT